jgi:predicted dehydrogenase
VTRIGIIGTGGIAKASHGPALKRLRGAGLHSVLSRDRERAEDFARNYGAMSTAPAHTELSHFLADPDLDAVLIASPDRLHAPQAIAAMRAGKHVLVEKPMATSMPEAREMVRTAAEEKVHLGVAFHLRWHAGHRKLREAILAGALGQLSHIRVHWTFLADPTNWRTGMQLGRWWSLAANGPHCVDLTHWFGSEAGEVVEAHAVIARERHRGPHDETALSALRFENGLTADITTSVLFESESRLELYGTKGSAQCVATLGRHGSGRIFLNGEPLFFEPESPFLGELQDFVGAIHHGSKPEVDGEAGLENTRILLALDP